MENINRSLFDFFTPLFFRCLDFLAILLAFYIAYYFRFNHTNFTFEYAVLGLLSGFMVSAAVSSFGGYASWRGKNRIELLGVLSLAWSVAFMLILALLVLTKKGEDFSRLWIAYVYFSSLSISITFRLLLYTFVGYFRSIGFNQKRVLIIGSEESAYSIKHSLEDDRTTGFTVFSAINKHCENHYGRVLSCDDLEELPDLLTKHHIPEVWFCLPLKESDYLDQALFTLRYSTVNVRLVPDLSDFRLLNHQITNISGMPTIDMSASPLSGMNGFIKRLEDLVLAASIFVIILPLAIIIALAIPLTSRGPVLFKQLRHGADGKPINVYKFRSMYIHDDEEHVQQATRNDSRITPLGAFLRKTSLDELPQFYNVLQGRMSVVGPRPHAMPHNEHYKELIESYMKRHKVKPGITGWAQVNGLRGETDTVDKMEKRVEFDLYYIDNWSLWFDIKIVIMTVFKGFKNHNAY